MREVPLGQNTSSHHERPTPTLLFTWVSTDTFRMSLCYPLHGVSYRDQCRQLQGRTGIGTASRPCPNSLLFPTPPAIHILYLGINLSLKRRWERVKVKFWQSLYISREYLTEVGKDGL